ncbi:alpha/beta fold hydrolase [Nocardioides piscis]|uniref:Alpha/beta fold hydrolase n=1 Tax=Nocardioides piscis TaxID=2714938 RepID=A0A6G7YCR3_9ACTN|nr:alpha/beta fold hydrolase [Nocardioides piscis]QIK74612.1 alpha/beta fold hydrolase [Nocardioides piscis]
MTSTTDQLLTRRTVSRPGVDLAVFEGGNPDGPTIVMVHGWPDTHELWRGVAEVLADDFRVVSYDTRGQGESPTDMPDAAFALIDLADDLFAVLDEVSPDAPVHVLGHDWGSVQSWEAVCRPGAEERIASFTSISGPNLDHVASWLRRSVLRPTPRSITHVVAQGISSAYVPFFVSPLAPPVMAALGGRRSRDMVSGLRYYRANVLGGHRPRQRRTRVPVLQLVLTRDPAIRPASLTESERWTEQLERTELPVGHWAPSTHPREVAEETARFVRSQLT